ncbi:hypothetical protein EON65_52650 [archaeon]|nr:MAG: hypothetical protein EON65_52650 [archaeon]
MEQVGDDFEFLKEVLTDLLNVRHHISQLSINRGMALNSLLAYHQNTQEANSADAEMDQAMAVIKETPKEKVADLKAQYTIVRKEAHRIKGSASYLCCEPLMNTAMKLQVSIFPKGCGNAYLLTYMA